MKILFMTNVPSPYRVEFFNELGKYCDLTVTFEKRTSDERDESWKHYKFDNFRGIFLKGISVNTDTAICCGIKKIIKRGKFDRIICADFASPTGMIAIRYMRKKHIPYWLESDGGFAKDGKGFKEKLKKYFIKGAEGYFSTGKTHDEYYIAYGAEPAKIYRYPFTSLYEKDILAKPLDLDEKQIIRKKLGLKGSKIVLAVGQFIHRKGFDVLMKAASTMDRSIGFYFVGGVPTADYLSLKENYHLDNVYFVGFKTGRELKEYYQAADIFVHPTREDIWGLVVNEAMACGLPIIATEKCAAGLELVKEGENGYIVNVGDEKTLSEKISIVLTEEKLQDQMKKASLERIKKYTVEAMAQRHMEIMKEEKKDA